MALSKTAASILIDLVENKLAMLQIEGREDLREVLTLQRCLEELQRALSADDSAKDAADDIPHRGRHRKLSALIKDVELHDVAHRQTA